VCRLDQQRSAKVDQVHELVGHVTSCFPIVCLAPTFLSHFDPVAPAQREHETRAMKRQLEEDFEREIAKVSRGLLLSCGHVTICRRVRG
jgi:hypothetical protein